MNWLDLLDDNAEQDRRNAREFARETLSEPCDDDYESTCKYVDMLPDDQPYDPRKLDGSPLSFGMESVREIDRKIQMAFAGLQDPNG